MQQLMEYSHEFIVESLKEDLIALYQKYPTIFKYNKIIVSCNKIEEVMIKYNVNVVKKTLKEPDTVKIVGAISILIK